MFPNSIPTQDSPNVSPPPTQPSIMQRQTQNLPYVPPFSNDAPSWFAHMEAIWSDATFTDEEKYQAVVRMLPTETYKAVKIDLTEAPRGQRFDTLKKAILNINGRSPMQYFQDLENVQTKGRRPSELLRHMQQLNAAAGLPWPDSLLRLRHSKLMPRHIQILLMTQPQLTLHEYGEMADTLTEAHADTINILTLAHNIPTPPKP